RGLPARTWSLSLRWASRPFAVYLFQRAVGRLSSPLTLGIMFDPLPQLPDSNALELEVLERWEREGTFQELRERNRGGPKWSFIDGPVTANKSLPVHTAWGRTLKDVFQRYKALRGFDQRYQNGFDCQGLWIEVGVERELGFNSKREIEEYGLEAFARKCRDVVVRSSAALTRGSKRLGQWMDWGNDYFTFSDTNIEYIWKFLKLVNERGWLYIGHRSTEWCPRCGTSLSQHELTQAGVFQEKQDPSLYVRYPLRDQPGEALVVWTTTPWTLPANVAAAVKPDALYGRSANGDWVSVDVFPDGDYVERLGGQDLVGLHYRTPFEELPAQQDVEHRVIPWDEVAHAARVPRRRRLVHLGRRDPAADARRQRRGGLAAPAVQEADGRLAAQHERLEHLAATLLRTATAVLSLRLRTAERDRLARGARR